MRTIYPRYLYLLLCLFLGGCVSLFQPKTEDSLPYEVYGDVNRADHITLLLPGIRNRVDDFTEEGFIEIARPLLSEFPQNAVIALDAHWGYYRERSIEQRIAEDILARYPDKTFSFVGISLGGFGSLLMATEFSHRIDKLILLSPFMGDDDYNYLSRLKGVGPVATENNEDLDLALNRVWKFMIDPARSTPIYIAYGRDDDFVPYYDHLRSLEPAKIQFLEIRGDHDWDTWRTLWRTLAPMSMMRY